MTRDELDKIAAQHMFMWARGVFDETRLDELEHTDRVIVEGLIESANVMIEWDEYDD